MKIYSFLFLLILSGICGCKVNKDVESHENENGTVTVKSTPSGGPYSTLSGHVKESKTGEPLPFGTIRLLKDGNVLMGVTTDMDGNFQLKNIPTGKYILMIDNVGYETFKTPIDGEVASTITVEVSIVGRVILLEKPVIYLYPSEKQNITVKLNYAGTVQHSYPTYSDNGWQVTAEPDGTLWDEKGQEYYALFWEGQPNKQLVPQNGFIVSGKETEAFLEEKLTYLGLNRREANEFIMYWLPRMENNPYNFIHFAGADYEQLAELNVTPRPETTIRVMMLTQGLSHKIAFPLQDVSSLKKSRKGFTLVEWGGCEVSGMEKSSNNAL